MIVYGMIRVIVSVMSDNEWEKVEGMSELDVSNWCII